MVRRGKPGVGRLVLLHGWGANSRDLLPLGLHLMEGLGDVVALEAPEPHPHVPGGRQWYPLTQEAEAQGWPGVPKALDHINHHLVRLQQEHPWQQTALLGFSQGAAMALEAAVDKPLAGVVACSGYPHGQNSLQGLQAPVLLIHGQSDPVVPLQASLQLQAVLEAQGCEVTLQSFTGEHTIPPEALTPVRQFLVRCFMPTPGGSR
ncbi:Phospholipase/carboxylesterase family protein,sll1284 homolog [Candidatus Synechococcus spongiarum]|uniref:Phospholipase/carboxylesterase family protein,sll1284 homolog n=2 Tax=Candidatus Synechococcus spongiarum TaxID=431041 RepID=A0A164Z774_9SYNE|nr:Phospholipase/carboxylesterase family protein,sll1284 homolog [Candidatus Synechococcus spongiarum]